MPRSFANNKTFNVPIISKWFCSAIFLPFFSCIIKIDCFGLSNAKAMELASPASKIKRSSSLFTDPLVIGQKSKGVILFQIHH